MDGREDETHEAERDGENEKNPKEDLVEIGGHHFPLLDFVLFHLFQIVYRLELLYRVVEEVIEVGVVTVESVRRSLMIMMTVVRWWRWRRRWWWRRRR